MPLFERGSEMVALWKLAPGTRLQRHVHAGGEETFVLEGSAFGDRQPMSASSHVVTIRPDRRLPA